MELDAYAEVLRRRLDEIAEKQGVTVVKTHPRRVAGLYAQTEKGTALAMLKAGFWRNESDGRWYAVAGAKFLEF